jgi:hypothetical protein
VVACRNKYPDSDTMTKLSAIDGRVIYLYCRCGHSAGLPVVDLLKTLPEATTVSQVALAARCKGCGVKGNIVSTRIVFAVPE